MRAQPQHDAVVVGSGPNGLAAAITLARAGLRVRVLEAAETIGGGLRSAALTLPGFTHDHCASVFPLGAASPFLRSLPLSRHGLRWIEPPAPLAHPLEGGGAVLLEHSIANTAAGLGRDGPLWRDLMEPWVARADDLIADLLAPSLLPRRPGLLARFAWHGSRPAEAWARRRFREEGSRALWAGLALHGTRPLDRPMTAAFAVLFAVLGHSSGWPIAEGGAQRLADALAACLRELGGEIETDRRVSTLSDVPPARAVLLDVTPRQFAKIAGSRLRPACARQLARFRYGPGAFKIDWALEGPIPWASPACGRAATVHLGGTFGEIAAAEAAVARGAVPPRPALILAQPSLFDPLRAPPGRHTAWAYAHVPNGSTADCVAAIEGQVERFAPGFSGRILARHVLSPAALEADNPNCVGGDIAGGAIDVLRLLARPFPQWNSYATAIERVYLCSASTPPGAGVHGLCGHAAALAVLRREFGA